MKFYYQAKTIESSDTLHVNIAYSPLSCLNSLLILAALSGFLVWNFLSGKRTPTTSTAMPFLFSTLKQDPFTLGNIFFLLYVLFLFFCLFRFLFFKEKIRVDSSTFSFRRGILGIGKTHKYNLEKIKNLRLEYRAQIFLLGNIYSMAFNYGDRIIRFGNRMTQSAAESLVDKMQKKLNLFGKRI